VPRLLQSANSHADGSSTNGSSRRSLVRTVPTTSVSGSILVGAGCIVLRRCRAHSSQWDCTTIAGLLCGMGWVIPMGRTNKLLRCHTRCRTRPRNSRRISHVLLWFPGTVSLHGLSDCDTQPVHRRRISCGPNHRRTRGIACDHYSTPPLTDLNPSVGTNGTLS